MSDESCGCQRSVAQDTKTTDGKAAHWLADSPVTEAKLPSDVRKSFQQFLDDESIETIADFYESLRERGETTFEVADLCHSDEQTPHWGETDGERHHFLCFYDAILLAEMTDSPGTIHTESPQGEVIEARASGDGEFQIEPPEAVMSFGIESDPETPDPSHLFENAYESICPYVKAFPDREAYEAWAARVPATTVGMELAAGTAIASLLS